MSTDALLFEALLVDDASWVTELVRARRAYANCILIHPSKLPTEEQLDAVHECLLEVING
jgi:hypothetical protein